MGLSAHTDHGLLTLVMQNELGGLQIQHDGNWMPLHAFLINTGDHLEGTPSRKLRHIYEAMCQHPISVGHAYTDQWEIQELVGDDNPAAYRAIKYRDYIHFQQSNELDRRVLLASYSDLKQNSLVNRGGNCNRLQQGQYNDEVGLVAKGISETKRVARMMRFGYIDLDRGG
ncbi:hypothetical protein JHK85_005134 [Glycine max]|nr:hypothetical protein JHK85_005134 [Glycine max]